MKDPMDVSVLVTRLQEATAIFEARAKDLDEAKRDEVVALNKLNEAQQALDVAMAELKQNAPKRSDWHTSAMTKRPIDS